MRIEQEEWRESMVRKLQDEQKEHEKKMREQMVKERNREIEAIINKLGDETLDTKKQMHDHYEKKVKEVEAKGKSEIEEYKATLA